MEFSLQQCALLAALLAIFFVVRWLAQPYMRYKSSVTNRNFELIDGGTCTSGARCGLPDLLRQESCSTTPDTKQRSIAEEDLFDLSFVVPCYNEESRLPKMLEAHLSYVSRQQAEGGLPPRIEFVLVDDGSRDSTRDYIQKMTQKHQQLQNEPKEKPFIVIRGITQTNLGKGGAVKRGVLHSRGKLILFLDADGATACEEIEKFYSRASTLLTQHSKRLVCLIGNRNSATEGYEVKRKCHRKVLNFIHSNLVQFVLGFSVRDTQCGFKMFSREAARRVFPTQHLEMWAFDIELLYLARQNQIPVSEVPVNWHDVEGSHLNVFDASLSMARDMLLVKALYATSLWSVGDYSW